MCSCEIMSLETSRMEVRNCSISRDLSTERAIECLLNSIVGIRIQPQSVVLISSSPMLLTIRMIYLRFLIEPATLRRRINPLCKSKGN